MGNSKLSRFGVFCRKLRLENRELLYDMAEKLDVSSAFLSKVENGKSKPPADWRNKLISLYNLGEEDIEELDASLYEAENRKSINISQFSEEDKALMWSFARKLDSIDREKLKRFLDE
jgi:transcriptional regulator with XRE-family HTH domain